MLRSDAKYCRSGATRTKVRANAQGRDGDLRQELAAGVKESPGRAGALGPYEELSSFLDAPILSQGTNEARRGSRKRTRSPEEAASDLAAFRQGLEQSH